MKNLKKISSIILSIILIISSVFVTYNVSAQTSFIKNGDFANGLDNWEYSANTANDDAISVTDGVLHIPERTATGSSGAYNRYINQKVTLPAGSYKFSFDADVTFTEAKSTSFAFGIDTVLHTSYIRPAANVASNITTVVSVEDCNELTTSSVTASDFEIAKFKANGTTNSVYYYNPASAGRFVGKIIVAFTLEEEKELYFSVGCAAVKTSAYIDNIKIAKYDPNALIQNGDFANGLNDWEYSANTANDDAISVTDGVLHIPERTATGSSGAYNRYINQKVTLPAGSYKFSFDADVTFTEAKSTSFAFGIDTVLHTSYIRPAVNAASNITTVVSVEDCDELTSSSVTASDFEIAKFRPNGTTSSVYYYNPTSAGRFVGKIIVAFTLEEEKELYFSVGCAAVKTSAYIDNIKIAKYDPNALIQNGDFANGLNDWEYSANKDNSDVIKATNGICYIPARDGATNGAYNRYINQKVTLPAGSYKFSFDADVTFASASNTAFCWAIRDDIQPSSGYGRPVVNVGNGIANASVSFETGMALNTADTTAVKTFDKTCYKKSSSDSLYYNIDGIADGRYVGKIITAFTLTEETTLWFSIGCGTAGAYGYFDNVTITKYQPEPDNKPKGVIINGDFANGLDNWEYSANTANANAISVTNGVLHIPERTATTASGAYNRYVNQKVTLPAGSYKFSFDADVTFTQAKSTSFAFGIDTVLDTTYVRPKANTASNITTVVSVEDCNELTTSSVTASDFEIAKFRPNGTTGSIYYYNPTTSGRFVGKISVSFTLTQESALYFSIGCVQTNTSAYIDNVEIKTADKVDSKEFSFDFETGGLDGILYRDTDADYSHSKNLKRTDEQAHTGNYSLSTTAISDESLVGDKVRGSFSLPINNLQKNTNYELNFWFKFKGSDKNSKGGFRVSSNTGSPVSNSLVSNNGEINYSSDLKFSDSSYKNYLYGWAGYIALYNTNGGSEWVNVSVKFSTGDFETVYLQFVNFAKIDTTFYIDDIVYSVYDKELPVKPVAKYDDKNTIYHITFEEEVSNPQKPNGSPSVHYTKTTKYAHTGKYSVEWNPKHTDGWENLAFTDKVGNSAYDPVLEPNTAYRYSCWVYAVGDSANTHKVKVAYDTPNIDQTSQVLANTYKGWQRFTYDFVTGPDQTNCAISLAIAFSGLQYATDKIYVDDIKLEKLVCSILATDTESNYCEDLLNTIDNGNFEENLDGTIWDAEGLNIKRVKESKDSLAPSGLYYAHLKDDVSMKIKIRVQSAYQYKFMYSYKTDKKSDFEIGILDDKGNVISAAKGSGVKHNSILTPTVDGKWHREGYTLFTPSTGYVYLYVSGKDVDIYLDAISLYKSRLTYETQPDTYDNDLMLEDMSLEDDSGIDIPEIIIPDIDIELPEDEEISNEHEEIIKPETDENKEPSHSTSQNENNILLWIIIIAVVVALAAVVTLIIFKKRRRLGK